MNISKAIEDFRAWYDNNKEFQNLKLYDFIVDDGGILYDGYNISPELKGYYIEFAASNPKDLDNKHMCTFGNPYWQVECRICKLREVQPDEDCDEAYDVIGMNRCFYAKDAFEFALFDLEKELEKNEQL